CIKRVCKAVIETLLADEVRWPSENSLEIPIKFMQLSRQGFPCVAGCVDGTLINIDAPTVHEESYVDRYGNHSINALMVCGPDRRIYYITARWPGSVHDARILRNSSLSNTWEAGWRPFSNAVILGDSAFGLRKWLIPPVIHGPVTPNGLRFLRAHRSTRRIIENCYGVLKEKFPCLNYLRLQPDIAGKVILTLACVFNIEIGINGIQCDTDWDLEFNIVDEDPTGVEDADPAALENLHRIISLF
ncbi:unnamed protein product, partial [Allacma fusca]